MHIKLPMAWFESVYKQRKEVVQNSNTIRDTLQTRINQVSRSSTVVLSKWKMDIGSKESVMRII